MVGDGKNIAKALRRWTRFAFPMAHVNIESDPTRENADISAWSAKMYPPLMRKLAKLPEFASPGYYSDAQPKNEAEKRADAYICGYTRGLQEAVYQYVLLRWEEEDAKQKRQRKSRKRK